VIVTIGLVLIFNGLASLIWTAEVRAFPSPFPNDTWEIGGVAISQQDVGTFLTVLVMVALLWAFFQFTKVGLALRASALNPDASRLVGVRVGWMLAIGWGLAAMLGALAGMLTAPTVFLDPNMMQAVLIYAFAAAVPRRDRLPVRRRRRRADARRRAEPDRDVRRLRRRRAAAARRAADHSRRSARQAVRPLRQAGDEARVKRSDLTGVGLFVLAAAAVFLLPRFISDFRAQQFAYVGIYFIALLGLNVLTGYTGLISLGHGAFMAIGGYTTAILVSDQGLKLAGHTFSADVKDIWTIPLAGLVAGLAGFAFGFPALRLTGLYLALATFAIAVAMPGLIKYDRFEQFTGGGGGINLFESAARTRPLETTDPITFETIAEPIKFLGLEIGSFNEWLYYLSWGARAADVRDRLALPPRQERPLVPRRPRQRAGSGLVRGQPRHLQDARIRDQRLLRRGRRLAARDRDDLRQPGHVPDHALDLPARRRRRRRASARSGRSSSARSSSSSCRSGRRRSRRRRGRRRSSTASS
jgi:branched-subunit amino acid ABC-type transport system permease component